MTYAALFPDSPDHAQLWVYASAAPMTMDQQEGLLDALHAFFATWASHGTPVSASATVVADRFLLVAGHIPDGGVSGCGIDASTRALNQAAASQGLEWATPLTVFYRTPSGAVEAVSRRDYRRLAKQGEVSEDGMVFDPGITSVSELRSGRFERPAADTWLRRYFRAEDVATR